MALYRPGQRPGAGLRRRVKLSLAATSTRTFLAIPAAVALEQAIARRPVRLQWTPLLAWGFLQYRLAGTYRITRAGGPPGMSQGQPDRLVTTGVYSLTRNPMYMGHLIFLTGLTLTTRSPLALAVTTALVPWFDQRARTDEGRLSRLFGTPYDDYAETVPRWLPGLPSDRRAGR
jgi:protein-S-isoprenylcysteine O-methyltransferase Ste14